MRRKITEPIMLESIETLESNVPDHLYVCWGSPEERCKGSVMKLSSDYKSEDVMILRYAGHKSDEREININYLKNRLKTVGKIDEIYIDEEIPLPAIKEIVLKIENMVRETKQPKISIDMSTPIKWHLFILLRFLDSQGLLDNIRFLYTEPEDYQTNLFQPLSFGIKEIFPIPLCYGDYDFSNEDLLVLILGYEGSRAVAMYENIDPARTLLLIADPPYHPEWKGRTEELNEEIINIVGLSEIKHLDSRNPVLAAAELRQILLDKNYSRYNHLISPLGTKPQLLGLYIYYALNPKNTILLYGAPLRHNEFFYSDGIGRTWELPFKKIEESVEDET
ncbi:hypothetical protein KAR91_31480 [Candidatus Pacearchaeota archaeon]|nr:hypothetical protein [Candidatus Pacearchaeota archaeon]